MTNLFPVFLKLHARRVVVVGGGRVAASKLETLLQAGADVTVIAPAILPEIKQLPVAVEERGFRETDLEGAWWVVAAAPPDVNRAVRAAAEPRRVFVNAVDDPDHASAYLGGVVRRDDVTVAISTNGRAPALAGLLREAVDAWLPADLNRWLAAADEARREWKRAGTPMERRRTLLLDILNRIYAGRPEGRPLQNGEGIHAGRLQGRPLQNEGIHADGPDGRPQQTRAGQEI